ncbi:MAG: NAD(+) synthase, partial [Bacteroidales bacterium]
MNITVIQQGFRPGRINENLKKIKQAYKKAEVEKSDLMVLPAQAICGFRPGDLLKMPSYLQSCRKALDNLAKSSGALAIILDMPTISMENGECKNSFFLLHSGKIQACIDSTSSVLLTEWNFKYKEERIKICYAEDLLNQTLSCTMPGLVLALDTYAFNADRDKERKERFLSIAKEIETLIYVNQCGGQEEYILRGASLVVCGYGKYYRQCKDFQEEYFTSTGFKDWNNTMEERIEEIPKGNKEQSKRVGSEQDIKTKLIYEALVVGIRDYFKRCGAKTAILGLSGGIDSAVVLPLAVDALGRSNVFGLMMPSQFSTDHSVEDAVKLAENLQIYYQIIPIKSIYNAFSTQLQPLFKGTQFGLAEENMQARIRGNLLMAVANKFGHLLLNTSNKSEAACGYGTMYGDLCGGLAVLADLYKSQVYDIAHYINRKKEIIPENCITKAPSAELRPDQKDSDSLPDYNLIEAILRMTLEEHMDAKSIIGRGYSKEMVNKILNLFYKSEYKRRQTPPALRI